MGQAGEKYTIKYKSQIEAITQKYKQHAWRKKTYGKEKN